ncbi:uncharacterized protein B0H18DRAFT_1044336 [Fomitopsis serialis]|uniref:uncharacterized protein n=1 Tax=Fomitopsis serialis TaxID=139415 RepID=UPI00200859C7|nr:uncharacterized protein B0H18DRAFT_1044336 [Neoantrodia serialis]KAH9914707.1 hypothetical protein B0H18DRAFT_1044336 [Neoantrodia serialis]
MPLHIRPAVRGRACILCNRHICATHLGEDHHRCPLVSTDPERWEQEMREPRGRDGGHATRLNLTALQARASTLRGGMGGQNYHIEVLFADGVSWLCRVQRQNAESPPSISESGPLSEAATLKFLSTTSVPVPKVFDVSARAPGTIGRPSLDWYDLDDAGKRKILEQFAGIQAELATHPLPAIGCIRQPGSSQIGPLVHERTATRSESGELHLLGPYRSALDMYTAFAKRQIDNILNEELYVDSPTVPLLVYRYLLDRSGAMPSDHIFVDQSLNIVSVIDWEWAQTMPMDFAFCAPLFLLDVGEFYDGRNELSADEALFASALERVGRKDLAACVRSGRINHRLVFCLEENVGNEDTYAPLFWGLRKLAGLSEYDNPQDDWKAWRAKAELDYAQDRDVRALQRQLEKRGKGRGG